MSSRSNIPLCVDLDGTLVKTDMLFECALRLVKHQPLSLFQMIIWLFRGKAALKREIVSRVNLEPGLFIFNDEILNFVRRERVKRKTILVTGSDQSIADYVATSTELFDAARGSDGTDNLTAENKRDWLVEQFGVSGYDYIGNDRDDTVVWANARHALFAGDPSTASTFTKTTFQKTFIVPKPAIKDYISLMRVHQWSKNTLIFIPFLLDHVAQTMANLAIAVLCFFAMSVLASMTYIVNDMLDLAADRANETKKKRALASCRVSIHKGLFVAGILLLVLVGLMLVAPPAFSGVMILYLICTLAYSFFLKRRMILDVCTIASLLTLRIVAGMIAIGSDWSFWLLAFSMFVFFSLAMAKRVSELSNLKDAGVESVRGRGYEVSDLPMLSTIGVSTGFISVLVIALFINSDKVSMNYSQPIVLWLLCPLLMYWVGRLWIITARGELHEDPIVFAAKDAVSIAVVAVMIVVMAFASIL